MALCYGMVYALVLSMSNAMKTRPASASENAKAVEVLSFKAPKAPSFSAWELALAELGEKR